MRIDREYFLLREFACQSNAVRADRVEKFVGEYSIVDNDSIHAVKTVM
jgi:hypothetical protein